MDRTRPAESSVRSFIRLPNRSGLGILFASLATESSTTVTNVLFGNLLAVSTGQIKVFALFTIALALVLAAIARPLMFASVNPDVAEAKGVAVKALGIVFLVLMGLVVTMAVQVVGTLLLFALVVTPPATALKLTARPIRVVLLGTAIGLGAVILGLITATILNLPPSFFVVSYSFLTWLIVLGATREQHRSDH